MGGYGSSRWNWHTKRVAAEDCRRLPLQVFKKQLQSSQASQGGQITWSIEGKVVSRIAYSVIQTEDLPSSLRLTYTIIRINGERRDVNYPIRLTMTSLPWGGGRYWFICPGAGCGRRVSVLYLATAQDYFLCRHCNRLSYRSRQEGYEDRTFYSRMAELVRETYPNVTWRTMKEIFKDR